MKKLILAGLAVLLALALVTCDGFTFGQGDDNLGYTDVVYSRDGKSVTLYLDGVGVPETAAMRALSKPIAEVNHNQFEVVFAFDADGTGAGTPVVARASWVRGDAAAIKGVTRSNAGAGVDYGNTSISSTTTYGAAILFVGRRVENTLLALGRLTDVDNGAGPTGTTTITAATKAVTFTIVALDAGTELADTTTTPIPPPTNSSFLTANGHATASNTLANITAANTTFSNLVIAQIPFPIYYLSHPTREIAASYTIETSSTTTGYTITDFIPGIIAHTDLPSSDVIGVQYYKDGSAGYYDNPSLGFTKANIATTRGTTINVTNFVFSVPATATPGVTAFNFQNPIIALTAAPSNSDATITAMKWFFRSAYGSNVMYLDEGKRGYGGAILLGIGDTDKIDIIVNDSWN